MKHKYKTISMKYGYLVVNDPDDGGDYGMFESWEDANEHIEELQAMDKKDELEELQAMNEEDENEYK